MTISTLLLSKLLEHAGQLGAGEIGLKSAALVPALVHDKVLEGVQAVKKAWPKYTWHGTGAPCAGGYIGIYIDDANGETFRFMLPVASARHLGESILEYLEPSRPSRLKCPGCQDPPCWKDGEVDAAPGIIFNSFDGGVDTLTAMAASDRALAEQSHRSPPGDE
ncbi:MAG: hypothetical protein DRI65_09620 [Chloroflexota bacterium]|nr:MAG: hypothetical protein DRI65_09620 [Chloroflexota bacterium]